jgi:cell division protein FtsW
MDTPEKDRFSWRGGLIPFSVLLGLVLGVVVVLQKDLGTASILALTSVSVYFLAGAPITQLMTLIMGGSLAAAGFIAIEPYRRDRLLSFLDPSQDSLGASYHIRQVLIALGSGGWVGVGLGQSRQKYSYVPETQTDSIFAILGEELGFAGAMLMAAVFAYLLWRGISVARRAPDTFGRLLAGGIVALLGAQIFINLFAMVALIPLTGVPLPFISYGGTSLIVLLGSIGILLNVSRHVEK